MRIAIWHNLPSGGGKRALYEQVAGLLARGHTLEAWCPSYADQVYLPLNQLIPEHVLPCPPVNWDEGAGQGPVRRLASRYRQSQTMLRTMLAHGQAAAAAIAQGGFDIVLAHPCLLLRVPAVGRYSSLPTLLYLHEPDRDLYEAAPRLPWAALDQPAGAWRSPQQWGRWLVDAVRVQTLRRRVQQELTSVQAFDSVLVNSLYSRESLLRVYGLEAHVCYLGVEAERFRPTGAPRQPFVVSLGAFAPAKRVDLALRALATIAADIRPELVWIANVSVPTYAAEMTQLAARCGVKLTVLVGITDAAVVDWLSRAAVMLYTPRLEPFGLAALEASACETPVVAVAEGGVRETIVSEVNGLLVNGADPAALGAAVQRVLADPVWARTLGAAGRQRVLEKWSWSASVLQLEEALRQTVAEKNRSASDQV